MTTIDDGLARRAGEKLVSDTKNVMRAAFLSIISLQSTRVSKCYFEVLTEFAIMVARGWCVHYLNRKVIEST